jgi:hypothetical protein
VEVVAPQHRCGLAEDEEEDRDDEDHSADAGDPDRGFDNPLADDRRR